MTLKEKIKKIKREIHRWIKRMHYEHIDNVDYRRHVRAVNRACRLSKKRKCKLWVIRKRPGRYIIRTKSDVKAALRSLGIKGRLDMFSLNDVVVYITK